MLSLTIVWTNNIKRDHLSNIEYETKTEFGDHGNALMRDTFLYSRLNFRRVFFSASFLNGTKNREVGTFYTFTFERRLNSASETETSSRRVFLLEPYFVHLTVFVLTTKGDFYQY